MDVRLRKASVADSEELHRIQLAAFKPLLDKYHDFDASPAAETLERVKWRFEFPQVDHYFIERGGERIGCLRVNQISEDACKLAMICVLPERQGRGYAQQAIKAAERLYPEAKRWTLDTIKQEPKLRHLYEKLGYRLTGGERNIKDGMDLVDYEK